MKAWSVPTVFLIFALTLPLSGQTNFSDFCDVSAFTLNGASSALNPNGDCVLRLTNNTGQSSSAFLTTAISLASDASFSTFFAWRAPDPIGIGDGDGVGADGLVFVVQTVANNVGGAGGGIGYAGIADSVGIEFDTYHNGWDPDGNHIGIDLEGDITSVATAPVATRMNDGATWYVWVDYNGATDLLEVRFSATAERPAEPTLTHTVDLVSVLGQQDAFIGFTSGTGSAGNTHEVLSWQFNATYEPIGEEAPLLAITKTASVSEVQVGTSFLYTITVQNSGDGSATGVTLTDTLPAEVLLLSSTASQGTCSETSPVSCNLGTIPAGGAATVTLDVRASAAGATDNVATIDAAETPPLTSAPGTAAVLITVATEIPTASEWALLMLAAMLAFAGVMKIAKH